MKSKVTDLSEIKFPCLRKSYKTGMVVLFTEEKWGIVLYEGKNSHYLLGDEDDFDYNKFLPFYGKIELNNETIDQNQSRYPCLKTPAEPQEVNSTLIVLFTSPKNGIVVMPSSGWKVGASASEWSEEVFIPARQTLVLKSTLY